MKQLAIIALISTAALAGCGGNDGTGRAYMPDMNYSRAVETYGYNTSHEIVDSLRARGIHYSGLPVQGSVARGDIGAYSISPDSAGLARARGLRNPLDSTQMSPANMKEAERVYLIHCGICHGTKLDGNGPLWDGGNGPYPAKPRELNGEYVAALTDGHIYHVITYGKGAMGAYAGQVKPGERWAIISYIRTRNNVNGSKPAATDTAAAAASTAAPNSNGGAGNNSMNGNGNGNGNGGNGNGGNN